MPKLFVTNSRVRTRALQIYLVLIGLAANRQTITYERLSEDYLAFGHGHIISRQLGCIMGWCYESGFPALTSLVVGKVSGEPGDGLTTVDGDNFYAAQQRVFERNWFSVMPPTLDELHDCGERARNEVLRRPSSSVELAWW